MLRDAGAIVAGMIAVVVLSLGTDLGLRLVGLYPAEGEPMAEPAHEFGSGLVPDLIGFKSFSVQLARLEAASSAWLR
jgi:hypothetical protein